MNIKVLGPGCINCKTLTQRALEAVQQLGLNATVEKVEEMQAIASYGIMRTPGLVIDDQVVSSGRVPGVDEIKAILLKHSGAA